MKIRICKLSSSFLSTIAFTTLLISTTCAQNSLNSLSSIIGCQPANCSASCSPSCSVNDVCTLGTMITCGVCPDSKCISRVTLGLPPLSNSTDTTNNTSSSSGGLIGGIVGGLLGGGLLICGAGFFIMRQRKKKMPLGFGKHHLERTIPATVMDEEMQERNTRQVMSGVIPVTFIPPSVSTANSEYRGSTLSVPEAETPQSRYGSFSTFAANHDHDEDEDPFSDRPISNAHSIMTTTTTYNNNSRRGSMESNISHQQVAIVVQATQVTRAKPQIMRVNTVKNPDGGLARNGSLKTIKPAEKFEIVASGGFSAPTTITAAPPATIVEENPFDDKNKVEQERNKVTDSVMSAPGDGEITIFWNGS